MRKSKHILPKEVDTAIMYFVNMYEIDSENYYKVLIDFGHLSEVSGYGDCLYSYYVNNPIKYIAALKDGWQVETPITQQKGLSLFLQGKDVVVIHKKTGARFNVNKSGKQPEGFSLVNLDDWKWFVNTDQNEEI
ncbi:hypothetical protein [Priestia megaterium]|uniref:hypothetical protein n=1 Tax=Priestia megaterium TaxID=1404 RepID=UPI00112983BF|nr:hypothetical protein [Priestia megaterium]TPF18036.1 hypothetical protein CBE78_02075 [Priestia megaterium]TPF22143.1 hypothetical protein CBE79_04580 [Priestia megaterium]